MSLYSFFGKRSVQYTSNLRVCHQFAFFGMGSALINGKSEVSKVMSRGRACRACCSWTQPFLTERVRPQFNNLRTKAGPATCDHRNRMRSYPCHVTNRGFRMF